MNRDLIELIPTLPLIVNPEDINGSTRLWQDLNLYGLTARRFIFAYGDKFGVDVSRFNYKRYFPKGKKNVFPKFVNRKKTVTLDMLEKAIEYGKLNDTVIENIKSELNETAPRKKLYFKGRIYYKPEEIIIYILLGLVLMSVLGAVIMWI